uniref:Reverse transcriptase domain-containing protein n=1 Tax=Tanacetum cinerariifolium TaxID=118510 RepID=A0A6L2N1H4_TANCI|nr:hypothetical protein [Tanacetum cinerariifolium]
MNTASSSGSGMLSSNTITNPKEDLKGITTRSGIPYKGPTISTTSSVPQVVERETKVTKDTVPPTNNGSTKDIQPSVVQVQTQIPNSEPVVAPVVELVKAHVSALKPNPKPPIPYLSKLPDQKLREKANDQMEKFFQIFKDLNFNISFADALILMPKFASTIKNLLTNEEKFLELARTPLNEHCSAVLLKKLPEKLGDSGKFFIPYRSISRPVGVVEDVFIKVGKFHFPADCVVVDFDVDPRVSLILGRSFLKTGHALIDVYEEELTLRVVNKAVTFNLDQTLRYSTNYDAESINRIDVIDVACEEYSQEVFGFFVKIDDSYYDLEGDILLLEEFLNDDPSSPPLPPQELKVVEPKNEKSFIDEPPVVELKDLPPHLEYAFLEGSLSLTQSPNSFVLGESLEIWDNHLCAIREHMGDSEWSRPAGLKLTRENIQSRVKEEDSITDVENASKGQSLHASRPSRLCAQAQSVDDMPFHNAQEIPNEFYGELNFFLGLQVKHKDDGIFISQDKYVVDILKKINFITVKKASTLIEPNKTLIKDAEAEDVDVYLYRSMIRSLMYLTTSRPAIMFAVFACARDSPFDLEAFSNSDYARVSLHRKSTIEVDGKEFTITEASVRRHLQIADADDEAVYEEWDDSVERATTTAASLDTAQDNGNILKTQSMVMPNVPLPQGIGTGGSPRVLALKTDLRQTKKVYGTAYTKLIMKGRMIEEIDQDTGITLVTLTKVNTYTRRRRAVSTGSEGVSTASKIFYTAEESVSTAGESMPTKEGSESTEEPKADKISQEDLQQMRMIVPVEEVYVEDLQVKYLIIDWERFDRDYLVMLWDLVKERFNITKPTDDKKKVLWVELKRLFEPDNDDIIWKL